MKSSAKFTAAIAAAALALILPTAAVAEDSSTTDSERELIVQLGDSYSSGNGAGDYVDETCWRSPHNYGQQVADALDADYLNAACSGAETRHFVNEEQEVGSAKLITKTYRLPRATFPTAAAQGEEWLSRMIAAEACGPLPGAEYSWDYQLTAPAPAGDLYTATLKCQMKHQTQINAVTPAADKVFLTTGGNDAGFVNIALACMVLRQPEFCKSTINKGVDVMQNQVPTDLFEVLQAIEEASAGNADVYVVNYPYLLATDQYLIPEGRRARYNMAADIYQLQDNYDQLQQQLVAKMNELTNSDRYHFVDMKPEFLNRGINPYFRGDQSESYFVPILGSMQFVEWVHPRPVGWDTEARVLLDAVTTVDNARAAKTALANN
ncbi:MAG: SGNH/GDSL hydrolase family protein [Trueperella sp.]|nr:SGNH/GDSL hydrolase family protein [Trueperella sp.]